MFDELVVEWWRISECSMSWLSSSRRVLTLTGIIILLASANQLLIIRGTCKKK